MAVSYHKLWKILNERRIMISEQVDDKIQSVAEESLKGKICTLDELTTLKLIIENLVITQKEIAKKIGKSERTIKNKVASLKEKRIYPENKW